ncbi:beta-agarase [Cellulophaga fucicola]|uniref:beta-agarase n=1 Tax=Cellulophaga fucicola TaxID=76595 RepID=UPI003EBA4F88
MKNKILTLVGLVVCSFCFSQNNTVQIDFTTQKFIGSESELNREKYFAMHGSYNNGDLADDPDYLFNDLGIKFGRTFGGPGPYSKYKKGNMSVQNAKKLALENAERYKNSPLYATQKTTDLIITDHPRDAYKLGMDFEKAATFNVAYIKKAYPVMPKYYEVMNEPFVHAKDFVDSYDKTPKVISEMSEFHKIVADKVHAEIPNIMVGGYSAAWPEYDKNNFAIWNTRMKVFMDTAGESMQFFATHIYDGRNVEGDFNYRSGSNSEAILDLIESYSYQKWGVVKPHLISEYGYTAKGLQGQPYSAALNGICLTSYNNILMSLLDKPDRLLKAVPFITGKATWFYKDSRNPDGHPYPWVLLRKGKNGAYKYTHLRKFWQLWKDVQGNRVYATSNNPDIQVHVFANKNKGYVSLNNLADDAQKINLDFLNSSKQLIKNATIKRSYNNKNGIPKLVLFTNAKDTKEITLKAGETVVIDYDLTNYEFLNTVKENNYYAKNCLQEIKANKPIIFSVDNVTSSNKGNATLKMGLGRTHNLSKKPIVKINGTIVTVPTNWAGYDQAGREQFFGVIPIPVDLDNIKNGTNTMELTFPDSGGYVSSIILNTENFKN